MKQIFLLFIWYIIKVHYIILDYTSPQCHYRGTAKNAEISLKECSAYGQIDQGGGDKEETHIYEHPQ